MISPITLQNDRMLRALRREPVDVTPIWIMRQAGRYLPEYREIRKNAGSFMDLCTNPQLACEVTLQPLRRYALDAAILFSDILTIPDAMGLGLYFEEGEGPRFRKRIESVEDINALPIVNPYSDLPYVIDAVRLISNELNGSLPLIGFSGSPWTLATYMVEGGSSKDFKRIKSLLYTNPNLLHQLLDKLADSVIAYLVAQIEAGVQIIQIFDTWGGTLTQYAYENFSLKYMKKIIHGLAVYRENHANFPDVPVIVFTKGGGLWLELIAEIGCQCIGLDWTIDLGQARRRLGGKLALQGNMDPMVLHGDSHSIRKEVFRILESYGGYPGHIFNLGHGISPDIPTKNVGYFVEAVHECSMRFKSI